MYPEWHVGRGIPPGPVQSHQPRYTMAKSQNSKKQVKKAPLKTAKEKKQAKQAKKTR